MKTTLYVLLNNVLPLNGYLFCLTENANFFFELKTIENCEVEILLAG